MSYLRRRCCTCGPTILFTSTTKTTPGEHETISRLDPNDFTTIVSRTTNGLFDPFDDTAVGVGGNTQRCWLTTLFTIYRLHPDTLALVASQSTGLGHAGRDVGGSTTRIWFAHQQPARVYEFDPGPPPSIVQSSPPPGGSLSIGIGGDDNVIWALGFVGPDQHIFELSPTDLSVVRDGGSIFGGAEQGCGGSRKVIWQTDVFFGSGRLHQRSPSDFTIIKTQSGFTDELSSAGGK